MNNPLSNTQINVICLESQTFFALIEKVVAELNEKNNAQHDKWIDDVEAMKLLSISSRTTLQKYRNEGSIRFSQPGKKLIFYDRDSILEFGKPF
jgi:hypothetical protein